MQKKSSILQKEPKVPLGLLLTPLKIKNGLWSATVIDECL